MWRAHKADQAKAMALGWNDESIRAAVSGLLWRTIRSRLHPKERGLMRLRGRAQDRLGPRRRGSACVRPQSAPEDSEPVSTISARCAPRLRENAVSVDLRGSRGTAKIRAKPAIAALIHQRLGVFGSPQGPADPTSRSGHAVQTASRTSPSSWPSTPNSGPEPPSTSGGLADHPDC
jgi:hypothetical protein